MQHVGCLDIISGQQDGDVATRVDRRRGCFHDLLRLCILQYEPVRP